MKKATPPQGANEELAKVLQRAYRHLTGIAGHLNALANITKELEALLTQPLVAEPAQ